MVPTHPVEEGHTEPLPLARFQLYLAHPRDDEIFVTRVLIPLLKNLSHQTDFQPHDYQVWHAFDVSQACRKVASKKNLG